MGARFDPSRVAVVDLNPAGVTLVRGNLPLVGQDLKFAYDELKATLSKSVDLDKSELLVISLIDNVGEAWAWRPEASAFGVDLSKYPTSVWPPYLNFKGWDPARAIGRNGLRSLVWWPIEGLPESGDPKTFLGSPGWDLSGLVNMIDGLVGQGSRLVVYWHCMNGADRTGALHGAWLMKAKGLGYDDALAKVSSATSAGAPNADYKRLMQAYRKSLGS